MSGEFNRSGFRRKGFLQALEPLADSYRPSPVIRRQMQPHRVAAVIGASGVGKNTTIGISGLPVVPGSTTRLRPHSKSLKTFSAITQQKPRPSYADSYSGSTHSSSRGDENFPARQSFVLRPIVWVVP